MRVREDVEAERREVEPEAERQPQIAPPGERATYVGFLNTVLGLTICVPILGGVLVDTIGFEMLFLLSLAFAALAMIASQRMSHKRQEY